MTHNNNLHAAVNCGDDVGTGDGAGYNEHTAGDGRGDGWGYGSPVDARSGDGTGCAFLDSGRARRLDGDGVMRVDAQTYENGTPEGDGWGIGDYS